MKPITSFKGAHRFLSNFWPARVLLADLPYPTVEHAYQAAKTLDLSQREAIRTLPANQAGLAKRMGRVVRKSDDWEKVKLDIMEYLLRQKFQHPVLKAGLLATGTAELIEGNTWGDTFWGVCRGEGENHLGKLLMKIRGELQ